MIIEVEFIYGFVFICCEYNYMVDENRNGMCGVEVVVELELEISGCE